MDLIRRFAPDDYARALESWAWLGEAGGALTPRLATAFGDVFLEGPDGQFWFLDTVEGSLTVSWASGAELQAALNTPDGQDRYLMAGLVVAASEAGLNPTGNQVLGFTVPPVLGGELTVENLELVDFVVSLALGGQIHQQVKDLPPGTPISGLQVSD
ncbi:T6SS immunity protein Tdi1 domain-containing protein [Cellulomonas sp.]|uniref:T6SS immunity protein Tdi1 domain-containing protein n=1 Tax=Cellulomonas sp. TaxID=40001 RepID=UPI001B2C71B5|nr:T6SS immunity protein Tdi1 domain-containing protein [Cellulomonas sp.]MBO9553509.1 DUF1851 domain-containing protein [Cellulomonas sp.]